jgi:hypothetical protein
MKLKLVLAICTLAAMPAFAQAKHGDTPPTNPKSTLAQVQKVVQIIMGNKTKLHQYCEIAKLDPQIVEAEQKQDINTLEVLIKRADELGQKIGPEYVMIWKGLRRFTRIPVKASKSLMHSIRSTNSARQNRDGYDSTIQRNGRNDFAVIPNGAAIPTDASNQILESN